MSFSREDYTSFQSEIQKWQNARQIVLPPDEYATVMSEFNTHLSDRDRTRKYVTKPIGDYYYTIINRGFDDYIVVGKRPIITDVEVIWEEET